MDLLWACLNREITASGSTVEAAVAEGARQLGVPVANVEYEVLTQPKKGFLGFGEIEAEVRVWCAGGGDLTALNFVKKLADDMNLGAEVSLSHDNVSNGDKLININMTSCFEQDRSGFMGNILGEYCLGYVDSDSRYRIFYHIELSRKLG